MKRKILIVENESIISLNLKRLMEHKGFEVTGMTTSGNEALELIKKKRPDLILIDIILSGDMDGIDAGKIIRDEFQIPVIYITAHSDETILHRAKETEPYGYIMKPVNQVELYSVIEIAFYKHQMEMKLRESEESFRRLSESSFEGVLIHDNGILLNANVHFYKMFGYSPEEISGKQTIPLLFTKDSTNVINKQIGEGSLDAYNAVGIRKDGTEILVEIRVTEARYRGKEIRIGAIRDVTSQKKYEEELNAANEELKAALEELEATNEELSSSNEETMALNEQLISAQSSLESSEKRYHDLFTEMLDGYALHEIIFDEPGKPVDYRFIDINPSFQKLTGLGRSIIGKTVREIIPGIEQYWIDIYGEVALTGESKRFENYTAGLKKWFEITAFKPGENQFACIFADISERKNAETELYELSARHRAILDSVPDIIMEVDVNKVYTWSNRPGLNFFGNDVIGKDASDYFEGEQNVYEIVQPLFNGDETVIYLESWQRRHDGEKRLLSWWCSVLKDHEGNPRGALSTARDITESRGAEEQVRKMLAEKELMLREIHHRVKNNMQIMTSLLNLQMDQIDDRKTREYFQICENRIRSMSLVHEKLYQSDNLASINFKEYLEMLIEEISESNSGLTQRIGYKLDIHDLFLKIDKAIPCGLIVTELITNTVKHAFPDNRNGEIRIEFKTDENRNYCLAFSDNGVGIPDSHDIKNSNSLGLQLVESLVKQLKGKMETNVDKGTLIKINFPE